MTVLLHASALVSSHNLFVFLYRKPTYDVLSIRVGSEVCVRGRACAVDGLCGGAAVRWTGCAVERLCSGRAVQWSGCAVDGLCGGPAVNWRGGASVW